MRETFPLGKKRDGALDYSIGCQILALAFILLSTQVIVGTQAGNADAHDWTAAQTSGGASTDGIQKRSNEFGIWGGISFDAPTLIGKTPDAKFGNIGLRYGRVLLASKTVAFEWTLKQQWILMGSTLIVSSRFFRT